MHPITIRPPPRRHLDQGIHKQIIETTTIFFAQGDRYPLITRSTYFVYLYMFISLISLVIIPYIYEFQITWGSNGARVHKLRKSTNLIYFVPTLQHSGQ
jgi:hypothetical protein